MRIRAALFDMDGTLAYTLEDIAQAMNQVLTRRGYPSLPVEDYRRLVSEGIPALITRALPPEGRDPETIVVCTKSFDREYARQLGVRARVYPGVSETLEALVARGVKRAVLSNSQDELVRLLASGLFPAGTFEVVRGAQDGVPPKPDPRGALAVAASLKVRPEEFLYLGDSGVDMQTATAASMFPVGALWGYRSREELLAGGARVLIDRPQGLLELLEGTVISRKGAS
ncbi:MAG: HAD family hydrolase [Anaerolineales bacterium]|jgi:phosphoglycolate phosphatase